ncbi:MAG: AAA family ATPase [Ilumatobacteraceae bacterium]
MGKTSLAKASPHRSTAPGSGLQFTPDLLPTDLVGVSMFRSQATETFVFQPGPLFANIVLADEINRASPGQS